MRGLYFKMYTDPTTRKVVDYIQTIVDVENTTY